MITREEILSHINEKYNVMPEYLFKRSPNYAILRHKQGRKWFAAIIDITEDKLGLNSNKLIDAILLKNDPNLIGSLRMQKGIYAGYHMNKEHWITVHLGSSIKKSIIFDLIETSFDLTNK